MCDPATLIGASLAIAGAQGVSSYVGQAQEAEAQEDYQERLAASRAEQIRLNNLAAQAEYNRQMAAENLQQDSEDAKASDEVFKSRLESLQAQATARAAAGEAGVAGLSVDQLLADYQRQEAGFKLATQQSREFAMQQSSLNKQALAQQMTNRINSIQPYQPAAVRQPSLFGTLAGTAGSMLSIGRDALKVDDLKTPSKTIKKAT